MFETSQYYFGDYEVVRLYHASQDIAMEVIPAFGARLNSLKVKSATHSGIEIIDGFSSEEDIFSDTFYKSAFLFPFPNRLKDGQFEMGGQTFNFPLNEAHRNNAIHGFIADLPFGISYIDTKHDYAEIQLELVHTEQPDYYPFSFKIIVTYRLDINSDFNVRVDIVNTSDNELPFGFGWHPYFTFPDWHGVSLKLNDVERIELNERALPSGEVSPYSSLNTFKDVRDIQLDDCFLLKTTQSDVACLKNGVASLTLWRDVDTIPYLQIFTPQKECIAIEPMTCNVDALNNKMGLTTLPPGQTYTTAFGITVT